jgi:hypothetical protein
MSMATLVALCGAVVLFSAGAKLGHFLLMGLGALLLAAQAIVMTPTDATVAAYFDSAAARGEHQIDDRLVRAGRFPGRARRGQQKFHSRVPDFSSAPSRVGFVGVCRWRSSLFCCFFHARTAADTRPARPLASATVHTAFCCCR